MLKFNKLLTWTDLGQCATDRAITDTINKKKINHFHVRSWCSETRDVVNSFITFLSMLNHPITLTIDYCHDHDTYLDALRQRRKFIPDDDLLHNMLVVMELNDKVSSISMNVQSDFYFTHFIHNIKPYTKIKRLKICFIPDKQSWGWFCKFFKEGYFHIEELSVRDEHSILGDLFMAIMLAKFEKIIHKNWTLKSVKFDMVRNSTLSNKIQYILERNSTYKECRKILLESSINEEENIIY